MALRVLQVNLNHARAAQDLFCQVLAKRGCGLGIVAEPYRVPRDHPCWFSDRGGSAAITVRAAPTSPPYSLKCAGEGFVAVEYGPLCAVAVYAPPSWTRARHGQLLAEVEGCVRSCTTGRVLVAGDFNAKSTLWGSPRTDQRGDITERWAAGLGLCLANKGHGDPGKPARPAHPPPGRWQNAAQMGPQEIRRGSLSGRDPGPHMGQRECGSRGGGAEVDVVDVDELAGGVVRLVSRACDVAMPRLKPMPSRRQAYRWTENLAALGRSSVHAKRQWRTARAGRCRGDALSEEEAGRAWRSACQDLVREICAAKERAWKELLDSVKEDPWGRPYRLVLNRLKPWMPPLTETLASEFVRRIVNELFPSADWGEVNFLPTAYYEWEGTWEVSDEELSRALKRVRKGKAPGADGIPGRA
ncbi:uncharacterized protein LOC143906940 [Temnothorax americanus]|uniref:uncharacterized protein LOC143906940 n=1 Tax=Temnothorax americanus TaxID=1964332 RepID=UPI004068F36B